MRCGLVRGGMLTLVLLSSATVALGQTQPTKTPPAPIKTPPIPGKTPPVPGKGMPWQAKDPVDAELGAPPQSASAPPSVPDEIDI